MNHTPNPSLPREYWHTLFHSMIMFLGQSLMNVVDLLFCKTLGPQATAVVGSGTTLWCWFMVVGVGMVMAFEFLIPNAIGEKDEALANRYYHSGIIITIGISILSTLGLFVLSKNIALVGVNPELIPSLERFTTLMSLSYLPTFLVPLFRVELQSQGFAQEATFAFLYGNILNAIFNYALVLGHFGFTSQGTDGSAIASVIARYGMLAYLGFRVIQNRRSRALPYFFPRQFHEIKSTIWPVIKMGAPISMHMLFEMGAFIFVSTLAAGLIAEQTAAHAITITVVSFSFMVPLGISSAAALTISKAVGEGNVLLARALGNQSIKFGVIFGLVTSVFYFFGRHWISSFYTEDPATLAILGSVFIVVSVFQLGDALQVILAGCLRGLGQTSIQAKMNFIGHWLVGVPLGLYLAFTLKWQLLGLWTGLCAGLIIVALTLFFRWRRAFDNA